MSGRQLLRQMMVHINGWLCHLAFYDSYREKHISKLQVNESSWTREIPYKYEEMPFKTPHVVFWVFLSHLKWLNLFWSSLNLLIWMKLIVSMVWRLSIGLFYQT